MQPICNGEVCFFCRKPIQGRGVMWEEQNNWAENPEGKDLAKVYLHPDCSVSLGLRLMKEGFIKGETKYSQDEILMLAKSYLRLAGYSTPESREKLAEKVKKVKKSKEK